MADILIIILYFICLVTIAIRHSKIKNTAQYESGGKQYSAIAVFCTVTASYVGGGFTIGLAEKTFEYGIVYIIAMFGFSIKEMLIAQYLAPRMAPFQKTCSSTGDIMELSYGKTGKILTGFASIIVSGGILGAQFAACGNILYTFFDLPLPYGIIITALVITAYVSIGGLRSVVAANIFNFVILFVMISLICALGIKQVGGINALIDFSPAQHFYITGGFSYTTVAILFISFFLGETLVPPYTQRLLIGKTTEATRKGTFYSGLSSILIFSIVGLIGIIIFVIAPQTTPHIAFPYSVSSILPAGIRGLGIVAMLAIIISSADAFLNATSVAVKNDVLEPIFGKKRQCLENDLKTSRIVTAVTGTTATIFALSSESILDILLYSYQFWTPFILVPLVSAIYQVKTSEKVFLVSTICGIGAVLSWNIFSTYVSEAKGSLEAVAFGMSVNLICFILLRRTKLNTA